MNEDFKNLNIVDKFEKDCTIDHEFIRCESLLKYLLDDYQALYNTKNMPKYLYISELFELQSILMYLCMINYPNIKIKKHKNRTFMNDR